MTFTPETYKSRLIAEHVLVKGREYGWKIYWANEFGITRRALYNRCLPEANIRKRMWIALHHYDGLGYPE